MSSPASCSPEELGKSAGHPDPDAELYEEQRRTAYRPAGAGGQRWVPARIMCPELYMMQQATQMITQMEPGYHMDAVLRVKNCLYAHYTGPMSLQPAGYRQAADHGL